MAFDRGRPGVRRRPRLQIPTGILRLMPRGPVPSMGSHGRWRDGGAAGDGGMAELPALAALMALAELPELPEITARGGGTPAGRRRRALGRADGVRVSAASLRRTPRACGPWGRTS